MKMLNGRISVNSRLKVMTMVFDPSLVIKQGSHIDRNSQIVLMDS